MATAHWDETGRELFEVGPLAAYWTDLGEAAGSVTVGVNRIEILPGKRSSPVHTEGEEEENPHRPPRETGLEIPVRERGRTLVA